MEYSKEMKKAGNIIVIFFLLIATGGIPISRHYCGESMISVSVISTPKPCCGSDCEKCRTENSFNKVTDNFTVTTTDSQISVLTISFVASHFTIDLFNSLPVSPFIAILTPRKFLFQKTGDFPVSFGNFRC
jgi:hypothetical protein